ncbi:MAG: aminopeptidase P family N-terminal domain-containing protein, partial [Fimbriiglobus sp.]
MDFITQRRQDVLKACKQNGLDALLVTHPANVAYLSGFTGSSGYLICGGKQFTLVTDSRYETQATEEVQGIDVHVRPHDKTTPDAAAELITKHGFKAVGLESASCTL